MWHRSILLETNVLNFETYIVSRVSSFHYNSLRSLDKQVDGPAARAADKPCQAAKRMFLKLVYKGGHRYDVPQPAALAAAGNEPENKKRMCGLTVGRHGKPGTGCSRLYRGRF